MPVRTRRQAAAAATKSNANEEPINESNGITKFDNCWDIPEKNFKSSVIKTYSKKQPFRTCWTSEESGSKKSKNSVKPQRTKLSEATSSVTNNAAVSSKKLPSSSNSATETAVQMSGCTTSGSTVKELRNKTRLTVDSMRACTVLLAKPSDINHTAEDMSLCSVANASMQDDMMIRNSTVLADCCNMNQELVVPNEISVIEGQNELHNTVVSNYDEQTPRGKQPTQTVPQSVKKVRFSVSQVTETPKTNQKNQPSAKRSILSKTPVAPRRNISRDDGDAGRKCRPKTSSPDPNRQMSMLHCEISTLLVEDYPNKKQSKRKSSASSVDQMTQDTEKLLDFEPLPLECSEVIGENSRDVTPEACNSTIKGQSSSVKRRRRLSYHFDEDIPACILLDHPVTKTKKKATVWFGKNPHRMLLEEIETIPSDILL